MKLSKEQLQHVLTKNLAVIKTPTGDPILSTKNPLVVKQYVSTWDETVEVELFTGTAAIDEVVKFGHAIGYNESSKRLPTAQRKRKSAKKLLINTFFAEYGLFVHGINVEKEYAAIGSKQVEAMKKEDATESKHLIYTIACMVLFFCALVLILTM